MNDKLPVFDDGPPTVDSLFDSAYKITENFQCELGVLEKSPDTLLWWILDIQSTLEELKFKLGRLATECENLRLMPEEE